MLYYRALNELKEQTESAERAISVSSSYFASSAQSQFALRENMKR